MSQNYNLEIYLCVIPYFVLCALVLFSLARAGDDGRD